VYLYLDRLSNTLSRWTTTGKRGDRTTKRESLKDAAE
jgi:hypothetical protein